MAVFAKRKHLPKTQMKPLRISRSYLPKFDLETAFSAFFDA